jgi:Fur family ferric uptake transcriptional regulator
MPAEVDVAAKKAGSIRDEAGALRDQIRAAGLKVTASRVLVLDALRRRAAPTSHSELAELLSAEALDRTTVYRNLIDLSEAGLASRHDFGDHVWRFEATRVAGAAGHPHITCTDCGTVACLDDLKLKLDQVAGKPAKGWTLGEVQLRGRCGSCK